MAFPLPIPAELRVEIPAGSRVLLAISGGVDSSVALAVLRELGCDVVAVTFKNFCYGEMGPIEDDGRSCCSIEAIEEARRIARRFDARHHVSDVSELFRGEVIEPFVQAYREGRTPNPCVDCNAAVRFPHLMKLADLHGCDLVATGHYARTEGRDRERRLLRGVDHRKDQAYFLHGIGCEALRRSVFPLGWFTKGQVREAAAALELRTADRPESQEICFVPDDDRTFLFADRDIVPGEIVDAAGTVLGRHRGLPFYTVGQRRGLGIAAARPLYVTALDPRHNRVVVGFVEQLRIDRIEAADFRPLVPDPASIAGELVARIRHRHAGAPVRSWRLDGDRLDVELVRPERGVAPGQALVLYADETVLGGGRIVSARWEQREAPPCPAS